MSLLYCSVCDSLLRTAVVLPCCQSPCCSACASGNERGACQICNKPRQQTMTASLTSPSDLKNMVTKDERVRDVVAAVSTRCPNDGCGEILRQDQMDAHLRGACMYAVMPCVFAEMGCTARQPRHAIRDHQTNACLYRMVSCSQRCGLMLPAKDTIDHIDVDCPLTLVPCLNRCGQDVQRGSVGEHDSVCPARPRSCPFRPFGCEVFGSITSAQLSNHMSVSVHAHLLLLDNYLKQVGGAAGGAGSLFVPTVARLLRLPTSRKARRGFNWDAGYVQCVSKWLAQESTINALAPLGCSPDGSHDGDGQGGDWPFVVSGCERGSLFVFSRSDGQLLVKKEATCGGAPVRSLVGTKDGRLIVGYGDGTVQTWMSTSSQPMSVNNSYSAAGVAPGPLSHRLNQQMVMPTHRHLTRGITHMAVVRLPRTLLAIKPNLLLVEGAVANILASSSPSSPNKRRDVSARNKALEFLASSPGGASSPFSFLGGQHCFECIVCLLDDQVALLEESMLQLILTIKLFTEDDERDELRSASLSLGDDSPQRGKRRTSLCMTIVSGRWVLIGCSDNTLRCIDLYLFAVNPSAPREALSVVDHCVFPLSSLPSQQSLSVACMCGLDMEERAQDDQQGPEVPAAVLLAMGSGAGCIVTKKYIFEDGKQWAPADAMPCPAEDAESAILRLIPNAHKGSVLSLVRVDGRHFASGGADECWRLWAPQPVNLNTKSDIDDGPALQIPAVDLPSSMYTCFVSDQVLYAAGGQGCVKEWTATTLRYEKR